ncbi:peptidylprolyl isomerase [Halobellus sp. Atlit-38R]|uniref:FKBP-type peptidyl-prolyl cis-trans isomerase n=1 Tax=Halobellus sp. Atlit-38R TaxID=2282131 RepID=UPI000EF2234E|nr:FKBP-type peptidyl-prolyl cis-trans isomerase [Halobellus sp. Atlit-38R]RLM89004.1 peptidylprolyl isomerase [Halobellus sp. Atlit-38R]
MKIEAGDRIAVEYVGRLEDGTVFGTSKYAVAVEHGLADAEDRDPSDYEPLAFTVGGGDVIEGLDEAVRGMRAGDEETIHVPPDAAYGEVRSDRVREYDPETFEGMVGESPAVGLHVHAQNGLHGDVVTVHEDAVEVDFNHELAGKTLVFEVEIVDHQRDG